MLFRIEDGENPYGCHRNYSIPNDKLPMMRESEIETFIAEEIRKEINNANDRRLLSYSKSLGVCLLKYNKYTDNELHINTQNDFDFVYIFDLKTRTYKCEPYSLDFALVDLGFKNRKREVILQNFEIDVSNNNLVEAYLEKFTGKSRKRVASPEKDREVLLMQSPDDLVISHYISSVYLLYSLTMRYGMKKSIFNQIDEMLRNLESYRFDCCGEEEREALILITKYLYKNAQYEKNMSCAVIRDSHDSEHMSLYYVPILQFHGIQEDTFEDSFALSDYNDNIVSDGIWHFYAQKYNGG